MKLNGNKKESTAETTKSKKGKTALIAAIAAVAVLAAAAAAGTVAVNSTDTIFPKVTVDGIDVGGLTANEAAAALRANGYDNLSDQSVSVVLPTDYVLTINAADVCTETSAGDAAEAAWELCHGGSAVGNALTYLRCRGSGLDIDFETVLTVDEDAVRAAVENAAREVRLALLDSEVRVGEDAIEIVKGARGVEIDTEAVTAMLVEAFETGNYGVLTYDAEIEPSAELDVAGLYDTVHTEPSEAYYDAEADEIVPETVGVSFDMDEAQRLWEAAGYGDKVYIPLRVTEPEVTRASLEATLFHDKLSSMSTSLYGSSSNRISNVEHAAASIDGTILMPGDSFSYNEALGERTAENGYLLAAAYSGGEVVQELGGGICQVSSTLYYCALYANLKITARVCHYFPVGYILPGLDATVSWGGPEFKFVNDRDWPIRIHSWVDRSANTANVELWGTDVDGSYVEMGYSTAYFYDGTYPDVALGYRAQTYRSVFDADGNLLSRKPESSSVYHYHDEDIKWPEPEETPESSASEPIEPTEPPEETEAPPPTETQVLTDGPEPTESVEPTEAPSETEAPAPTDPVGGAPEEGEE